MEIRNVTIKEELDALYAQSAFTLEGLDTGYGTLKALKDWLNKHKAILPDKEPICHCITGRLMNKIYHLTGSNAYPSEDFTIVCVTNIDSHKLVIPRFEIGGRWFDDVVLNNAMREESK